MPIACYSSGDGPPLVMVHGAGSARWSFDLVRPRLEGSFTVTAVDRRGRGDSGDGDSEYALADEFDDIAAVVHDAGEGALLFGHSYGALAAAGAAARIDGLPKLVLYEPPMGGSLADQAWIDRYETHVTDGERAAAVRDFLRDVGGYSDEQVDAMEHTDAWVNRLAIAHTAPRELRAERALELAQLELERLTVPTLMLVGSNSPVWAQRSTEAYAAALPDARVKTLEGHGHAATMSAPELLSCELESFLLGR